MSPNPKANCYGFATGCWKLYFFSVGGCKPKMVGENCIREYAKTSLALSECFANTTSYAFQTRSVSLWLHYCELRKRLFL